MKIVNNSAAITVDGVSKFFGKTLAVDKVNLTLEKEEILALVGPNGAGKTTLLKMIVGLLAPDGGTITVSGYDINRQSQAAKVNFGYVPDDPTAYEYLTGNEFLSLTGKLRSMKTSEYKARVEELIPLFPIGETLAKPIAGYSRGNKQKVAFLAAMLTEPQILIIDEPIVGLDPRSIEIMGKTLVAYAKRGHSVLFVTHIVDFAVSYATRAVIMDKGSIVKTGKPEIASQVTDLF